uniref:Keratin-associated protein n=1 Tax=Sciurus vulgaris TaxID=55149 RepID=A0A8D2BDW4_SCIVU
MSYSCHSGNFSSRSFGGYLPYSHSSCGSSYPSNLVYVTNLHHPSTCHLGTSLYRGCQETFHRPSRCHTSCVVSRPCQPSCHHPRTSSHCSPCQRTYATSLGFGSNSCHSPSYGSRSCHSLGYGSRSSCGFRPLSHRIHGCPSLGHVSRSCHSLGYGSRSSCSLVPSLGNSFPRKEHLTCYLDTLWTCHCLNGNKNMPSALQAGQIFNSRRYPQWSQCLILLSMRTPYTDSHRWL